MKNLSYLVALHAVNGLGPIRLKRLVDHFKDPKLIWESRDKELRPLGIPQGVLENLKQIKSQLDPEKNFEQITKSGIQLLTIYDKQYPPSLKQIYDPPIILYCKGKILPQDAQAIAIVGTRKVTGYGKSVTENLTTKLSQAGLTIISGLARGVDTLAHKAALEAGGRTIAVLGGGLNKLFPPENHLLVEQIIQGNGAVITEFPPDYPALAGNFPARNRIVAGLSLGVVVTEAAEDSGSLITARLALEQGKDVFAVPGPITSNLSKGPADLIKAGAALITDAQDVLEILNIQSQVSRVQSLEKLEKLSEAEKQILICLQDESKHIDEVCRALKKPSFEIAASLVKMEISGVVKNLGSGNYTKGF